MRSMNFETTKVLFWATFALAIIVLAMNFGIGLIAFGLIILPVLTLHLAIGIRLSRLEGHGTAVVLSYLNLLAFALVRPDGVHTITDTGLSALLSTVGIHWGYNDRYESHFFYASVILLIVQVIMDLRLRKLIRAAG